MSSTAVVVPVHRETASLSRLLTSLCALDAPLRVVVAVDGAWPATVDVARRADVEVLPLEVNRGSYAARNAALAHLFASDAPEVVLFTDADCTVTPSWVPGHLKALEEAELSAGAVRFTFRGGRPTPAEWVDATRHLRQDDYVRQESYGATCNLAVRGSLLARDRFDDSRRTGGDAEFCRRVVAAGARIVYTPDAVVEHPARDLRELWTKVDRLMSGIPSQADRWAARPLPRRRPTRAAWRRAQEAGLDGGLLWGLAVSGLDWAVALRVRRARLRAAGAR